MNEYVELIQVYIEEEGGEVVEFGTNKAYKLKAVIVNGQVVKVFEGAYIQKNMISKEEAEDYAKTNNL